MSGADGSVHRWGGARPQVGAVLAAGPPRPERLGSTSSVALPGREPGYDRRLCLRVRRAAGGQHLPASAADLLTRIAVDDHQPTASTVGLLNDTYGWSAAVDAQFRLWHEAMIDVHSARPAELSNWLALLIQVVSRANHQPRATTAALLVATTLTEPDVPTSYVRAVLAALKRINLEQFTVGDPFIAALAHIHRLAAAQYPGQARLRVYSAMSRAPLPYQLRMLSSS